MTTCLKRPETTYFVPQVKKKLPKTATAKLYPAEKWESKRKKKNVSPITVTLLLLYNAVCLMRIKTGH